MHIIEEPEIFNVTLPGQIQFHRNQELMLHLNRKYSNYNFYTMQGPVGLKINGDTIEATTHKARTQARLHPLDGMKIKYACDILEDIVEPIIEELIDHLDEGTDVYLYLIGPTGAVKPKNPAMTFMIRGNWPNYHVNHKAMAEKAEKIQ